MSFFGPKNVVLVISPSYGLRFAQPRTLFWDFGMFQTQWQCLFDLILVTSFCSSCVRFRSVTFGVSNTIHGEESFRAKRMQVEREAWD